MGPLLFKKGDVMAKVLITAAVISNYAGMDAMIGKDGQVYLGKRENYHSCIGEGSPAYYDNSDSSLQLISSNEKIFSFLYGEGWTLTQRQMIRDHCFTKADYIEFAGLREGVLSKFQLIQEVTFAGKPFVPPKIYHRRKREQSAAVRRKER